VDRTCSGHGIEEKCLQIFVVKLKERGHLENLAKYGRIILKWSLN
jgi:hypothetical protein